MAGIGLDRTVAGEGLHLHMKACGVALSGHDNAHIIHQSDPLGNRF